jgi:nicotinic acid mononucleotide adenylyltransferase
MAAADTCFGLSAAGRRRLEPLARALACMRATDVPRLEVVSGTIPRGARVGLLAGTFNPMTRAHAALAVAGHRAGCERVALVMAPTSLDKEGLERAHAVDRLDWVCSWARRHAWAVVAVSSRSLLVDMAEALAGLSDGQVVLLLGTDKAEQLADPRYYEDVEEALQRLGKTASLLVADRLGHPAAALPLEAGPLRTPVWAHARSSTEVREAASRGEPIEELVPSPVARAIASTHAYDPDPRPYLARARELDALAEGGTLPPASVRPKDG